MQINGVKVWTVQEAAEHFNRCPRTIYNWIERGTLSDTILVGSSIFIPIEQNKDATPPRVGRPPTVTPTPPGYWTMEQAAEHIGVTAERVRQLCKEGQLAGIQPQPPGPWFVRPQDARVYKRVPTGRPRKIRLHETV